MLRKERGSQSASPPTPQPCVTSPGLTVPRSAGGQDGNEEDGERWEGAFLHGRPLLAHEEGI